MKIKNSTLSAIIISVALHLVFFTSSAVIPISSETFDKIKPRKFFHIKALQLKEPVHKNVRKEGEGKGIAAPVLKFESPEGLKLRSFVSKKIEKVVVKKEAGDPSQVRMTKLAKAKKKKEFEKYWAMPKDSGLQRKVERKTRKTLLKTVAQPDDNTFTIPDDVLKAADVSKDFFDKMPGLTPKLVHKQKSASSDNLTASIPVSGGGSTITKKTEHQNLEKYLHHELEIYEDPQDGQKYYKLSVRAGEAALVLPSIPKEIVFLIDCSISTEEGRLNEFKEGIKYSLTHLNKDDLFNIVAFKKKIYRFQPSSVSPKDSNKAAGLRFVENLTAGEKTDTYNALVQSINVEDMRTPAYIVLLSDGRPTKGVTDPRKLINEISRLNNGKVSIFSFSGGLRVNRYLLDFIAYKNRGWAEYSYRTHLIAGTLANLYEKIRDPILLNLRYYASGLNNEDIFPKMLPDFFRNTEFTLYGKYTEAKNFSLQLLGEGGGYTNEFVLDGSLAKATQGSPEIARGWAFNKIYHLIGLLEHGKDNKALVQEIHFLSKKFNIKTPYAKRVFGQ
ncbi:hypothetical protein MNBD_UNCLBAC01-852 [hydrothermal vent metagenome]|uniref:VWFA domain-containing protein n=1 Tax=hydrothermal vent metagenome TaxID=652676 RepID=A0A3B1DGA7_9ZZZZ